jgi:hypothetical protein
MDGLTLAITLGVSAICMGLPIYYYNQAHEFTIYKKLLCISPILLLLAVALFAVKSYHLEEGTLCIKRPLWMTRIALSPLESAEILPGIMAKSWRVCGSGGMFGWIGWFRNGALGPYRAWVTDRQKTVVLEVAGKTYVVSPLHPEKFLQALQAYKA